MTVKKVLLCFSSLSSHKICSLGRVFFKLFCVDIQTIQKSARKERERLRERERESGERESFSGEAKEE